MDIGREKPVVKSEPIHKPVPDLEPANAEAAANAPCTHEWFEEDGYLICAHCGWGSPELGFDRAAQG